MIAYKTEHHGAMASTGAFDMFAARLRAATQQRKQPQSRRQASTGAQTTTS